MRCFSVAEPINPQPVIGTSRRPKGSSPLGGSNRPLIKLAMTTRPPAEAALLGWRGWRAGVEKLRNGSDKLSRRERLRQHDAVRDTLGRPIISVFPAHVNDGKVGIDFSGVSGNIPAVDLARTEINVRDERPVFPLGSIKQLDGIFAGRSYDCLEPAVSKALFDDALKKLIVFND